MGSILKSINSPQDLKSLTSAQLRQLSREIRRFLIENVSKTGGHLASNLGVVELTLALHKVFNTPKDKIVWDVGHQAYVHKIVTGRKDAFVGLRQLDGLSGFPKPVESAYDCFPAGHSSISISVALGMAKARDLRGTDEKVVAVIGDGSMTGGVAFEGLNNAGRAGTDLLVILNDNQMSISRNVGGLSRHLGKLRVHPEYLDAKKCVHTMLERVPAGERIANRITETKDRIKYMVLPGGVLFEELGFRYMGPVDGHDMDSLLEAFAKAKSLKGPVLVHVQTVKGKGYGPAEKNPSVFHGVGKFDIKTGIPAQSGGPSWSSVFGNAMVNLGKTHPELVAITAAMEDGTGLGAFEKAYPGRFFDVGIAEQHAVSFAAGLAAAGLKPVFAVYSTFLQRAYDQIVHDVCMESLPVIFAIDRAGIVGADGETHQGVFDIAYLNHIPNMTILAPKDGKELENMLAQALSLNGPAAIRYPRGTAPLPEEESSPLVYGKSELLSDGEEFALLASGSMVPAALQAAEQLRALGKRPMVINARYLKPLDQESIRHAAACCSHIFTLEDHVVEGGFGSAVAAFVSEEGLNVRVHRLAFPDSYIPQGTQAELYKKYGLDADGITAKIREVGGF